MQTPDEFSRLPFILIKFVSDYLPSSDSHIIYLLNRTFYRCFAYSLLALKPKVSFQRTFCHLDYMYSGATNLIQNPSGVLGFLHWTKSNGGDGWAIENWPNYRGVSSAFVSSFSWCMLAQEVNLRDMGWNDSCGIVVAGAVVCCRKDCGGLAKVTVKFSGDNTGKITTGEFCCREDVPGADYYLPSTISVTAKIPQGCSSLLYEIEGKDTKGWKGYYGARFLHTFMYVVLLPDMQLEKGRK